MGLSSKPLAIDEGLPHGHTHRRGFIHPMESLMPRPLPFIASLMLAGYALIAPAHAWETPARGTPLRAALMDAIRPGVESQLGFEVEFVIDEARVAGLAAFVMVRPQHPGGRQIRFSETLLADQGDFIDTSLATQALLRRTNSGWAVAAIAIGATDVWWANHEYCAEFARVIPEVCTG
jgi:hypothetical protein